MAGERSDGCGGWWGGCCNTSSYVKLYDTEIIVGLHLVGLSSLVSLE